ncbi:MAG: radical SAM protein [Planctomycetes bacterium]|nr:radical SAM protein [Planctomycetota bacterium]
MLKGIHFLLTYTCNFECDHCFLYCGPRAQGTFTLAQIREALIEAKKLGTINSIYFEGGEPFLYYPLLLEGLRLARDAGFETGVVTNCYWATTVEDAKLWVGPMQEAGINDMSLSDDAFHHGAEGESPAKRAAQAAADLGVPFGSICIEAPAEQTTCDDKGKPVIGGSALFKGRAAEKLTDGLPTRQARTFKECTREELVDPHRVHIDAFGNVHICQGISMGNMWKTPLSELAAQYDATAHPICGPLIRGGPAELARTYDIELETECVDECHYCFLVRRALIDRFPEHLVPRQVYGFGED